VPGTTIDWWPLERLGELQAFIDERWRRGHVLARDAGLLRWQHRRRRDPERLSILVAARDDRILGMLGLVEFDACADGQRFDGGWMTTWLVVPEARGRRLGLALVDRVLGSEYAFVGALDANAATRHVLGRSGFASVPMLRWIRVLDREALQRLLAMGGPSTVPWAPPASPPPAFDANPSFVGGCRDEAFLRRRYEEHPSFEYEVMRRGDGLAVSRVETVAGSSFRVLRIVDFLGPDALAEEAVDAARRAGVVFADFSCTSGRFGAPLERTGFTREDRLPEALPARFQPLELSHRPVVSCFWAEPRLGIDLGRPDLYVTRADSDLDRPN
jgi:hypothetical protein